MPSGQLETVLGRVEEVAREVAAPRAEQVDREACWPEASLRALQATGLGGLVVSEAHGGMGLGLLALAMACERLGEACGSTGLCFGMHCVGAAVIDARATPEQQARYLEPIVAGQHLTTLALSEPGTGVHFYLPEAELRRHEADGFIVSGTKAFVTNGGHADSYVVSTVSVTPGEPPGTFSCVVVPAGAPGVTWGPPWQGMGMRGNSSRTMRLDAVPVPAHNLLGAEGDQIWYIFQVIAPYFLMAMAGTYLGIAQAALNETRQHLMSRVHAHSGRRLGQQAVIQHRLGCLWAEVERSRQFIYAAAQAGEAGSALALPALCSAKAEVSNCVVNIANEAMTLVGGRAYHEGSSLQRHLRNARAAHIMSPITDLLRTWVGRSVLDLPLLADT